jgi:hypothetical protein
MPYDPGTTFKYYTRDEVIQRAEVIVEGIVEPYRPTADEPDDAIGFTKMRIDRVWKGDPRSTVVVIFPLASMDCSEPPPSGQRLRFGAHLVERSIPLGKSGITLTPQRRKFLETYNDVIYFGRSDDGLLPFALPLDDERLEHLLADYKSASNALETRATAGGRKPQLLYADYLAEHNEAHRAFKIYESLSQRYPDDLELQLRMAVARTKVFLDDDPEATLSNIAQRAPKSDEWRNKIARARLAATGKFTQDWKDWSNLKSVGSCNGSLQNFEGAIFDNADLAECSFVMANLNNASFLHANLERTFLELTTLAGAKYDCATKLPSDLNPVAAGMINVEGSCAKP